MSAKRQSKYVPPNQRKQQRRKVNNENLQQEIDLTSNNDFPELGSSKPNQTNQSNQTTMNFANATREDEVEISKNEVANGWVKLTRNQENWKIEKKYGDQTTQPQEDNKVLIEVEQGLTKSQYDELQKLVQRWQNDRDIMNEHLEEMSPYWDAKDLTEPLSDGDYESEHEEVVSDETDYDVSEDEI